MSKRAIDPLARARAFTKMPSPRRQVPSTERRLNLVERAMSVAISAAAQPTASTPIETLDALPQATSNDIGRQIIVQLPGDTLTSIYVGVLFPDGTVNWQLMAAGIAIGGSTSPDYTFVGHVLAGAAWDGIWQDAFDIYVVGTGYGSARRYARSTGIETDTLSTLANSSSITTDTPFDFYASQPGSTRIRRSSFGSGLEATSPTAKTYNALYHVRGTTNLYATSAVDNALYRITMTTLAIAATVTTSILAPRGVAVDSAGNVYVANTGNNTIRKYTSALVPGTPATWGSAGTGNSQFNTIKQMAFDSADRLYVCDSGNNRVQVFDTAGTFLGKFGSVGSGSGQFNDPSSVYCSGTSIVVADRGNSRVSMWLRA